ncbi:MAG: hypothetical protein HC834_04475 [Rhodospirillales bacterium]|nr:hypothetical protein [Rhodospirillales bacterium]
MLQAFVKAIEQIGDPALRRIVLKGLLFAVGVFALLWGGVTVVLTQTTIFQTGWLDSVIDVLGGVATLALTWLLFPAVVTAIMGIFLDDAADAVERRHYPQLMPPRRQSIQEIILNSAAFLGITVLLNLLALPFLLIAPVFPFVFYGVNGYLLGREYFEVVALRRLDPLTAKRYRRTHRLRVFLAGLVIAFLFTIPVINFVAPVIATAAMAHLFMQRKIEHEYFAGECYAGPHLRGSRETLSVCLVSGSRQGMARIRAMAQITALRRSRPVSHETSMPKSFRRRCRSVPGRTGWRSWRFDQPALDL